MIGLDANLLVRFLAQDDERQSALANALIETCTPAKPGFISKIALVETVWVLSTRYKQSRAEIEDIVTGLLRSERIVIEDRDEVEAAIKTENGTGLADRLIAIAGRAAGCDYTATFDKAAAKLPGMRLLD